ncbi:MAG: hypothetical protein IJT66_01180 [Clostridia bacterium]|nr:hypothetical protein [Clostridia bacterium]
MVILFSGKTCVEANEITEILSCHGAVLCPESRVVKEKPGFFAVRCHRPCEIRLSGGTAVVLDRTDRFASQRLPAGMTGICEEENRAALSLFRENSVPVVTCGMNAKSTVTLSSVGEKMFLVALQRGLTDRFGRMIEPGEFRISFQKEYRPFSVMAALTVLLLNGLPPSDL